MTFRSATAGRAWHGTSPPPKLACAHECANPPRPSHGRCRRHYDAAADGPAEERAAQAPPGSATAGKGLRGLPRALAAGRRRGAHARRAGRTWRARRCGREARQAYAPGTPQPHKHGLPHPCAHTSTPCAHTSTPCAHTNTPCARTNAPCAHTNMHCAYYITACSIIIATDIVSDHRRSRMLESL